MRREEGEEINSELDSNNRIQNVLKACGVVK